MLHSDSLLILLQIIQQGDIEFPTNCRFPEKNNWEIVNNNAIIHISTEAQNFVCFFSIFCRLVWFQELKFSNVDTHIFGVYSLEGENLLARLHDSNSATLNVSWLSTAFGIGNQIKLMHVRRLLISCEFSDFATLVSHFWSSSNPATVTWNVYAPLCNLRKVPVKLSYWGWLMTNFFDFSCINTSTCIKKDPSIRTSLSEQSLTLTNWAWIQPPQSELQRCRCSIH